MFVARCIMLSFMLLLVPAAISSEAELESDCEKKISHRRQLSAVLKRGHRRFVSLMRPPTVPAVFDSRHARTPSEFTRKRSQFKSENKTFIEKLRCSYEPDEGELDRALIVASCYELPETIALLLEWGARVNVQDRTGKTAAMHACIYGNYGALEELIGAGADLTISDEHGKTALVYSCPGQIHLDVSEWGSIRIHETNDTKDPRTKCRILVEMNLEQGHLEEPSHISSDSSGCFCLIL